MDHRGLPGLARQSFTRGGLVMDRCRDVFAGINTSNLRNAVAVAEAGRGGVVRLLGESDTTDAGMRR